MVNFYDAVSGWTDPYAACTDTEAYAEYSAQTGTEDMIEFHYPYDVSKESEIKRVYVRVKYNHNLSVTCSIGIGTSSEAASGGSGTVTTWHVLASGYTGGHFIDITADHPTGTWAWEDFDSSDTSAEQLGIFLKTEGATGEICRIYNVRFVVVTESEAVDPETDPLVLQDCRGTDDELGGNYTESGGYIRNPADIEQFLLRGVLGIPDSRIDLDSYVTLREYFDDLGIEFSGAIQESKAAQDALDSIREEFGYRVFEIGGKFTAKSWPSIDDDANIYLHPDNSKMTKFERSPMSEVINYPIMQYSPKFYLSDQEQLNIDRAEDHRHHGETTAAVAIPRQQTGSSRQAMARAEIANEPWKRIRR